jgi:hypothetical protein
MGMVSVVAGTVLAAIFLMVYLEYLNLHQKQMFVILMLQAGSLVHIQCQDKVKI